MSKDWTGIGFSLTFRWGDLLYGAVSRQNFPLRRLR
jgi:hypothetical protein